MMSHMSPNGLDLRSCRDCVVVMTVFLQRIKFHVNNANIRNKGTQSIFIILISWLHVATLIASLSSHNDIHEARSRIRSLTYYGIVKAEITMKWQGLIGFTALQIDIQTSP